MVTNNNENQKMVASPEEVAQATATAPQVAAAGLTQQYPLIPSLPSNTPTTMVPPPSLTQYDSIMLSNMIQFQQQQALLLQQQQGLIQQQQLIIQQHQQNMVPHQQQQQHQPSIAILQTVSVPCADLSAMSITGKNASDTHDMVTDDNERGNHRPKRALYRRIISNIADLPDEALAAVAKFLSKPSRALFAVAMTPPSLFLNRSLWKLASLTTTNRAILSLSPTPNEDSCIIEEDNDENGDSLDEDDDDSTYSDDRTDADYDDDYYFYLGDTWKDPMYIYHSETLMNIDEGQDEVPDDEEEEDNSDEDVDDDDADYIDFIKYEDSQDDDSWTTLDFEDVEESLARKLSDDDIRGVLICIDGVSRLHTIRLCGCVNITGSGLYPVMGSNMLRTIDFSLVRRFHSPIIDPEPNLSEECVIPILKSILDAVGSSLKDVMLPRKFLQILGEPNRFVEKYYDIGDHIDLLRWVRSSKN